MTNHAFDNVNSKVKKAKNEATQIGKQTGLFKSAATKNRPGAFPLNKTYVGFTYIIGLSVFIAVIPVRVASFD